MFKEHLNFINEKLSPQSSDLHEYFEAQRNLHKEVDVPRFATAVDGIVAEFFETRNTDDARHIKLELGDMLFYVLLLAASIDIEPFEIWVDSGDSILETLETLAEHKKKVFYQGLPFDRELVKRCHGLLIGYIREAAQTIGSTLEEVLNSIR